MKRFVNGVEVELGDAEGVEVVRLSDRLLVRSPDGSFSAVAVRQGDTVHVSYRGQTYRMEKAGARARAGKSHGTGEIHSPMPGQIADVMTTEGASVTAGTKLLVLEAMKTQQTFTAPFDGVVEKLPVVKGQQVRDGDLLALVSPATSE